MPRWTHVRLGTHSRNNKNKDRLINPAEKLQILPEAFKFQFNKASDFLFFFFSLFKNEIQLTYNIMIVSGVQHNDLMFVYIAKRSPR